jgi:hypothetical protein
MEHFKLDLVLIEAEIFLGREAMRYRIGGGSGAPLPGFGARGVPRVQAISIDLLLRLSWPQGPSKIIRIEEDLRDEGWLDVIFGPPFSHLKHGFAELQDFLMLQFLPRGDARA